MVTIISIVTISRSYFLGHVVSAYHIGLATLWNGRDIGPSINSTQYFTRRCMLRISTPDLTFHHCHLPVRCWGWKELGSWSFGSGLF